jgi:hypothetical protein
MCSLLVKKIFRWNSNLNCIQVLHEAGTEMHLQVSNQVESKRVRAHRTKSHGLTMWDEIILSRWKWMRCLTGWNCWRWSWRRFVCFS